MLTELINLRSLLAPMVNGVNEDRKCGVSDGVKLEQMAAKYTAASFLELRTI